jgi:hypothetical protein
MVERAKSIDEISIIYLLLKLLFVFLLKFELVTSISDRKTSNHSCYTCVEPLVGYSKNFVFHMNLFYNNQHFIILADHTDSCRFFNIASPIASSYIQECHDDNYTGEYECRKLIISYRSIDTYLRRDCAPKGLCSWKDRTQSMIGTPISDCVYTDDLEQKLECIYCCDTPLCNRTMSYYTVNQLIIWLLIIFWWKICNY